MYLLSRIIFKEWFKSFFGALAVLFILVTVGDIINGFLQGYPTQRVLIEYALKLSELMGKCLPICSLLASLFTINHLKDHSELLAILAAGYSGANIYKLIFFCSLSVGILQFINLGYLQPLSNGVKREQFEKSRLNESKYIARSIVGTSGVLWYKSKNYFAAFSSFDSKSLELKNLTLYFINSNSKINEIVNAQKVIYLNDQWVASNVIKLTGLSNTNFFPSQLNLSSSLIQLEEKPSDFNQFKSDITTLVFKDLLLFTISLYKTGINSTEYELMLLDKIALSLICIVFSFLPLSGIFNPGRRNTNFGRNIVFVLIFSILFWLSYSSLIALCQNGKLPPLIATLSIPILFFAYVLLNFKKNRKL